MCRTYNNGVTASFEHSYWVIRKDGIFVECCDDSELTQAIIEAEGEEDTGRAVCLTI